MAFTKDNFLSHIREVNDHNYCYGNELLYKYCGFGCLPSPDSAFTDTKFSSAIWLIGTSYCADPTRSSGGSAVSNEGLGLSFERIAKEIPLCANRGISLFFVALLQEIYSPFLCGAGAFPSSTQIKGWE